MPAITHQKRKHAHCQILDCPVLACHCQQAGAHFCPLPIWPGPRPRRSSNPLWLSTRRNGKLPLERLGSMGARLCPTASRTDGPKAWAVGPNLSSPTAPSRTAGNPKSVPTFVTASTTSPTSSKAALTSLSPTKPSSTRRLRIGLPCGRSLRTMPPPVRSRSAPPAPHARK